jgi:hypothetical protein
MLALLGQKLNLQLFGINITDLLELKCLILCSRQSLLGETIVFLMGGWNLGILSCLAGLFEIDTGGILFLHSPPRVCCILGRCEGDSGNGGARETGRRFSESSRRRRSKGR